MYVVSSCAPAKVEGRVHDNHSKVVSVGIDLVRNRSYGLKIFLSLRLRFSFENDKLLTINFMDQG